MSVKIYYGWRFKRKHLAEFTTTFRDDHFEQVVHVVRKLCMKQTRVPAKDKEWRTDWDSRVSFVIKQCVEAAKATTRQPMHDIECGWRIWIPPNSTWCFATTWGDYLTGGDRIKLPEWLEEYGYWNNTDPLDSVTTRQWNKRKNDWKCYTQPGGENYCVKLPVVDLSDGVGSYHRAALYLRVSELGEPSAVDRLAILAEK